MKRLIVALLAAGLLAGCGSATSSTASDPAGSPGSSPTQDPFGTVDGAQATLISVTAAGGQVSPNAVPLDTPQQVADFASQFRGSSLQHRIMRAIGDGGSGQRIVGAVVAVGCDRPPGVDVTHGTDQIQIVAQPVASPLPECLAAVTTVAVVTLPA